METVTEFLLARIAEDAATARQKYPRPLAATIALDAEAKREIIEGLRRWADDAPSDEVFASAARRVLSALALPYADHPDPQ